MKSNIDYEIEIQNEQEEQEQHMMNMKLDPEHLLYSSLSLLNYDFQEESKILNVKIGPGTFDNDCPKAFYNIVKFLLCKLISDNSETIDLLLYYPPRNPKDTINFKAEAYKLLLTLKKRHVLPESLFLSKIILDEVKGQRCIQFLRFLSEITLKNEYINQFPQGQLKVFNINQRNDKKTDHQLHQIDEFYPTISILNIEKEHLYNIEDIQEQTEIIKDHLEIEYDQIQKKMMRYGQNSEEISILAERLNIQYQKQRETNLQLKDYLINIHDVPDKLLSDLRKLDRMPQIDLIKQTIIELQDIQSNIQQSNFKERYNQFVHEFLELDSTNVINKNILHIIDNNINNDPIQQDNPSGIIQIDSYYQNYKNTLNNTDKNIQNLKTEEFLTYQSSLLNKLKNLKTKQSNLTQKLITLKSNIQEEL